MFVCARGYASESDGEELAGEGDVHLPQDLPGRGNVKAGQSAIRLSEVRGLEGVTVKISQCCRTQ